MTPACGHCGATRLFWDVLEGEWYCYHCGWRPPPALLLPWLLGRGEARHLPSRLEQEP